MKSVLVLILSLGFSGYAYAQMVGNFGQNIPTGIGHATEEATDSEGHATRCGPYTVMECVQGIAAAVQIYSTVATMVDTSDAIKKVSSNGMGDFNIPGGLSFDEQMAVFNDRADKALDTIAKKGYKYDKKKGTISGPGGKSAPLSSLNSGKALADSGLINDSDVAAYDAALAKKKTRNKIIVKSLGGAKGGYSARKSRRSPASAGETYRYGGIDQSKISAAQTSGLTKDFGGTPIGVASDDLFNMLTVRYESLASEKQFIENATGSYPGQR